MKVILNDFIEHLGERGDSVSVKPGQIALWLTGAAGAVLQLRNRLMWGWNGLRSRRAPATPTAGWACRNPSNERTAPSRTTMSVFKNNIYSPSDARMP